MNRATIELGFILKQIPDFDFSMNMFSDRLRLQKTIYLLQAFGIYLGYDFSWYLRGPYCSLLATNGFELESVYEHIPDDGKTQFQKNTVQKRFREFLQFVRDKTTAELEIAASLHYLKKTNYADDDKIKSKVETKQKQFTKEQINRMWEDMKKWELI